MLLEGAVGAKVVPSVVVFRWLVGSGEGSQDPEGLETAAVLVVTGEWWV